MRDIQRERGSDTGRGRSRLHAGSPTWDSISDPRIRPWAEGGAKPLSHRGCPPPFFCINRPHLKELKMFPATNLPIGRGGEGTSSNKRKPKQKEKERFPDLMSRQYRCH